MGADEDFKRASEADKLRRRAEEQLTAQAQKMRQPRVEHEAQRLLHELQVYQLELEMQLEQLHQAKEELELSRNKYAELYDLAPVGYFTFDSQGLICELNLAGAQMLGVERQLLTHRPFVSYVAEGGKSIFSRHLEGVVEKKGMMSCEIELVRHDGMTICGHLQSSAVTSDVDQNVHILTSIIDITEH